MKGWNEINNILKKDSRKCVAMARKRRRRMSLFQQYTTEKYVAYVAGRQYFTK
jgi:hypothetical protein